LVENTLKKFILSACYGELVRFNKYKEKYTFNIEENTSEQWTYIVEMMIITAKSLIPSNQKSGVIVDYERFSEELKLWAYYRHGENNVLINTIRQKNDRSYWYDLDDSVYSRIVPIVAANENWEVVCEEVVRNALYTVGNIQVMIECILLSKLLFTFLSKKNIEYSDIILILKEEIIGLSQRKILTECKDAFRVSTDEYSGNYLIDFERKRIDAINLLNGVHKEGTYEVLSKSLEIISGDKESSDLDSFFVEGFKGLYFNMKNEEIKINEFILNLCGYLIKLRKGRIAIDSLKKENYKFIDIFKYKEGDVFVHPILNKCKVISRKELNEMIILNLYSKSGKYRFIKKNR